MGDNRPNVYFDPDVNTWVYRISSLGHCETQLVYARLEYPTSPHPGTIQKAMDDSSAAEGFMYPLIERDQDMLVEGQQMGIMYQVEMEHPPHPLIRGSIDGYYDDILVEVKWFGESLYEKFRKEGLAGFPHYKAQVDNYGWVGAFQRCLFAVGRKDEDGKPTEQVIYEWYTPNSTVAKAKAVAKIKRVENLAREINTGIRDVPVCETVEFPCPYWTHHPDNTPVVDDLQTTSLLTQYMDLLAHSEKDLERAAELKTRILKRARLIHEGHDGSFKIVHPQGTWTIWETEPTKQSKFNRQKFERDHPGVLDDYLTETDKKGFVTLKKPKKGEADG